MRRIGLLWRREVMETVFRWTFLLNAVYPLLLLGIVSVAMAPVVYFSSADPPDRTSEPVALALSAPGDYGSRLEARLTSGPGESVQVEVGRPSAEWDERVRAGELDAWVELRDEATFVVHEAKTLPVAVTERLRWALIDEVATEAIDEARWQRVRDVSFDRVAIATPGPTALLYQSGGLLIAIVVLMLPSFVQARLIVERSTGLLELLFCSFSNTEVIVGKTLSSVTIAVSTVTLWLLGPSLAWIGLQGESIEGFDLMTELYGGLPSWSMLAAGAYLTVTHSLALVMVVTAASVAIGNDVVRSMVTSGPILLGGPGLLIAFELSERQADQLALLIGTYVPGLGAPIAFWRLPTLSIAEVVLSGGVALVTCAAVATVILWLGRSATVLGGLPRSLADLRRAAELA